MKHFPGEDPHKCRQLIRNSPTHARAPTLNLAVLSESHAQASNIRQQRTAHTSQSHSSYSAVFLFIYLFIYFNQPQHSL